MTLHHPQSTRPEWRPRLAGRQLTDEKQERGLNYFGIANSSEKFFFMKQTFFFLILQTRPSKTLYFGGICFVHHATFFGWIEKKNELSDISRATCSQIGQSRFVHFILRCHSVIVISHLSQIYCCFYSDLRT